MMKKTNTFIIKAILLVAISFLSVLCIPKRAYAEETYECVILDYAELLSDSEEEELLVHMNSIVPYGNVIFQTVTLTTGAYESYSEETYYEYFGNEPGVIFQIDMGNRKLTISSSTALDDEISYERDTIVDNVYRYATDGDYLTCAAECFDEIYAVLNDEAIAHNMKYIDNAIIAIIISLIFNFLVVFSADKKKKSAAQITGGVAVVSAIASASVTKGKLKTEYSPISSGSSGSSGGGGFSGGGGGFSGGSSSHGF